jgi:hypothetical protein
MKALWNGAGMITPPALSGSMSGSLSPAYLTVIFTDIRFVSYPYAYALQIARFPLDIPRIPLNLRLSNVGFAYLMRQTPVKIGETSV